MQYGGHPPSPRIHVRAPLPQNLPGREISSVPNPDMQGFASKLKDICCRKPKPFPPDWPPLILFRNDASVVVVPYDNPRVRDAQSPEDLLGQDIGFVYVRRIISGGTSTGYCGPNGVWCPPREEPFYNVRVIGDHRERQATFIQFTKLGNPSQVVATLPAEVAVEPSDGREIGIMDSIDSPNEPFLKIRWRTKRLGLRTPSIYQFPSVHPSTTRDSPNTQAPVEVSRAFCRPGSPDEEVIKEEVAPVQATHGLAELQGAFKAQGQGLVQGPVEGVVSEVLALGHGQGGGIDGALG
jgi:hypothetical protein